MSQPTPQLQTAPATSGQPAGGCFHCGEPCADNSFSLDGNSFCCFGCQTVFSLLRENGLSQFYALNSRPGTRIRAGGRRRKMGVSRRPGGAGKTLRLSRTRPRRKSRCICRPFIASRASGCWKICSSCIRAIGHSQVNFSRREAAITFAPDKIKFSELAALLASIGYEPEFDAGHAGEEQRSLAVRKSLAANRPGRICVRQHHADVAAVLFRPGQFERPVVQQAGRLAEPGVGAAGRDLQRGRFLARGMVERPPTHVDDGSAHRRSGWRRFMRPAFSRWFPGTVPVIAIRLCGLIFFLLCGRLFQKKTHERLTFDRDYKGFFPLR